MPKLWINDLDVSTLYGLWLDAPDGWGDAPAVQDTPVTIPGRAGGLVVTDEAQIGPRTLEVHGSLIATNAAALRTQWDALKRLLAAPWLEVRSEAWPDRVAICRYQQAVWGRASGIEDAGQLTLRFLMPSPYFVATQVDVVTLAPGLRPTPLTLGSAPSLPRVILLGIGQANPAVRYYDAQGRLRGEIAFTLTLATGEWIDVDGGTGLSTLHTASGATVANAAPYLSASSDFFVLDPTDGDGTGGPGLLTYNCNGILHLRRSYL